MSDDQVLDNIDNFTYYIGVVSSDMRSENPGQPILDFFLEIPPEIKLKVKVNEILGEQLRDDPDLEIASQICANIAAIRLRARCSDMMTCLLHSSCQITRKEMEMVIKTIERKRLMEAQCLL